MKEFVRTVIKIVLMFVRIALIPRGGLDLHDKEMTHDQEENQNRPT